MDERIRRAKTRILCLAAEELTFTELMSSVDAIVNDFKAGKVNAVVAARSIRLAAGKAERAGIFDNFKRLGAL